MERKPKESYQVIPIRNLYYMLSYAFQNLKENGYKKFAEEEFENAADLLAAILIKGVSIQLRLDSIICWFVNLRDFLSFQMDYVIITCLMELILAESVR